MLAEMEAVTQVWHRVYASQAAPDSTVAAVAAVLAAVLVYSPAWRYSRHLVTIAHEGAHGVLALLVGRRLSGIRLHSDTSGLTISRGRPRGPGVVAMYAAGYLGPTLFGLLASALLLGRHAVALLWVVLALLALLLLQIRNWFGLLTVLGTGLVVFGVSWWVPERGQSAFAYLIAAFLLLGAPRPVLELQAQRRRRRAPRSDADELARLTGLPGLLWVGVFLLATVGSLALGTWWVSAPYR
ncbi:M50 family metallopeptidase [Jatrophihabitans telluris]|uniref:M50 family metallopeptidase n=1 Tax=Jatrophihabitans telluris TaxID=2038343 RepID=A0ABY4R2S1_9ACTN|nr:M50 family metallopeptidase [Jatrophihabitans telluris]UQX89556.1 M50 family metallopeptidase [Jatrophihabitans telluris]